SSWGGLVRMRELCKAWFPIALATVSLLSSHAAVGQDAAKEAEKVIPISALTTPFPGESASKGVTKFSFIAYGDTRGRRDGVAIQYEHSLVIDSMLAEIKKRSTTDYPVKFVLQSGDAVVDGREAHQWNVSFVPLINRLSEAGVPYFLVPGNHEGTTSPEGL